MALPASFSNNVSPTGPQLDQNFAAVAAMGSWLCAITGTNTLTLTVGSNQPDLSAYIDAQEFRGQATGSSTGTVTASVVSGSNTLSALPVYLPSGVQAGNGDINNGAPYTFRYQANLNSGAGGFRITSALPSSSSTPVALGAVGGLLIANNSGIPNTQIDISASSAVMVTPGGVPVYAAAVAVTIDLTTTGANGMDAGSRPTSGWVYLYLISNGATTAGLATATSPTAGGPTMPSGYMYKTYVGAAYCNAAQNLLRTRQQGRSAQYQIAAASPTATLPVAGSGNAGTYSTLSPVLASLTVAGNAGVVPLTAQTVKLIGATRWKSGAAASVLAAPNTGWGGTNNGPLGSTGNNWPIWLASSVADTTNVVNMDLESTAIAWASNNSGGALSCLGWVDGYVNA